MVAKDDQGAESIGNVTAQVNVGAQNDVPTLTTFAGTVDTTNEDVEVEISLSDLSAQGDEADVDGTVDAFVVKTVSSGTLKIGTSAGTATAWAAGTNDTIDATNQAYWTPGQDANGILNAFEVVAEDDQGGESTANITAQVNVGAQNDVPTLTTFAGTVDTTNEDVEVEISLSDLSAQGDEADVDGTVDAFVVKTVSSGTLKIGTSTGTATAWAAGTNDTIDATNQAYWTPGQDANGILNAFEVVAEDDQGGESTANITAQVNVGAQNDVPTLTTFAGTVDTTNEDVEVEISLSDLSAQGDEADVDGTVDAFVVKTVSSGTLKIGTSTGTATALVPTLTLPVPTIPSMRPIKPIGHPAKMPMAHSTPSKSSPKTIKGPNRPAMSPCRSMSPPKMMRLLIFFSATMSSLRISIVAPAYPWVIYLH